jgi:hypothetical protein
MALFCRYETLYSTKCLPCCTLDKSGGVQLKKDVSPLFTWEYELWEGGC